MGRLVRKFQGNRKCLEYQIGQTRLIPTRICNVEHGVTMTLPPRWEMMRRLVAQLQSRHCDIESKTVRRKPPKRLDGSERYLVSAFRLDCFKIKNPARCDNSPFWILVKISLVATRIGCRWGSWLGGKDWIGVGIKKMKDHVGKSFHQTPTQESSPDAEELLIQQMRLLTAPEPI